LTVIFFVTIDFSNQLSVCLYPMQLFVVLSDIVFLWPPCNLPRFLRRGHLHQMPIALRRQKLQFRISI